MPRHMNARMEQTLEILNDPFATSQFTFEPTPTDALKTIETFAKRETTVLPVATWMLEACGVLARGLLSKDLLPVARMWEDALRAQPGATEAATALRGAISHHRTRLQAILEASDSQRAIALGKDRERCAQDAHAFSTALAASTAAHVSRIDDAVGACDRLVARSAACQRDRERVRTSFTKAKAIPATHSKWRKSIAHVIDEEFDHHLDAARASWGEELARVRAAAVPPKTLAPAPPKTYGNPSLDAIARAHAQCAELEAMRQFVGAFRGASHLIGSCLCGEGTCTCSVP